MINKALTLMLTALVLSPSLAGAVEPGDRAPAFVAVDVHADPVTFPGDYQGTATVLLFWATWCPYCKAFMPELAKISADYDSREVRVLGINFKEDGDVAAYVDELDFEFRTVIRGDTIAEAYGVEFSPGIMVVDGRGVVTYRRAPTEMPPGEPLAHAWSREVRAALDAAIQQ